MKRFFCTICGKVKRVRTLPRNTQSVNSMTPEKRVGTCDRHSDEPVKAHTTVSEVGSFGYIERDGRITRRGVR